MDEPARSDFVELTNPRSDRVRSLRKLSGRAARLKAGQFIAEGPSAVREALLAQRAVRFPGDECCSCGCSAGVVLDPDVQEVFITTVAQERHRDIVNLCDELTVRLTRVSADVMATICDTQSPQGVAALVPLLETSLDEVLTFAPRLIAVLSQVRDPGNAGTVIRAADAAGADVVILTESSVDPHNPKCVRSTTGSLFHVPVVTGLNLADVVQALREQQIQIFAADGAGTIDLDSLVDSAEAQRLHSPSADLSKIPQQLAMTAQQSEARQIRLSEPTAWIFGNEAWGLAQAERALADAVVKVPIHGKAESLNLGTAATICLYASARAQR